MKSRKLRDLFSKEGVVRIVGAHDGLTAKLVERNGFDGVWASGFEISAAHAVPDANILTMTQYLEAATIMNEAVSIPVVADCDTGYGNANNVIHMVNKYESAGIAAVVIEDKKFPKVNSYIPGRQELAAIPEFVGKIQAAKNAQQSLDFMVIARVEALIAGWGMEEALHRARAYAEAGADAVLIHSKMKTPDEIRTFVQAWDNRAPLVIVPTSYPSLSIDEIRKLGIKMVIYANHGLRAAVRAVNEVLTQIRDTGRLDTVDSRIVPMTEIFELQGMTAMKEAEKVYLRSEDEPIKVIIPAAGAPKNQPSLEPLLQERPLAMLDIRGKPLLQRNVETLNKAKLYDISVIRGYRAEALKVDGVTYFDNPDYATRHILSSIMCAEKAMDGKTIIVYSDILFDDAIIERFKRLEHEFVLVMDSSFKKTLQRNKKLDLVSTIEELPSGDRHITYDHLFTVKQIGCDVPEKDAGAEFIGMMALSERGTQIFKDEYHQAMERFRGRSFAGAQDFSQASLVNFLQYLIRRGYCIKALPVNSGWMEIHTYENYVQACSLMQNVS